jgi:hypothetical protein
VHRLSDADGSRVADDRLPECPGREILARHVAGDGVRTTGDGGRGTGGRGDGGR